MSGAGVSTVERGVRYVVYGFFALRIEDVDSTALNSQSVHLSGIGVGKSKFS